MEEREARLTRPRSLALDVAWFLLTGAAIGLFLGRPFVGAVAGVAAWRVRRAAGQRGS